VATAVRVDAGGNVYVTGYSRGTGSEYDYVTIKYDLTGRTLWERRRGGPARSPSRACALQVDGRGDIYVTGCGRGRGPDFDYVTLRYGPTGDLLWDCRYDGPSHSRDGAMAVEVDTVGNVYVTGASWIDGADYDFVTVKYSPDVVRFR
jgi:outer membrane protein assembly factor BamB